MLRTDGEQLQELVKFVGSSQPNSVAAAVRKELLRFSDVKRRMRGFDSPSREPMQPVTGRNKTKASTTSKTKGKKHSRSKSMAADGKMSEVKLSSKVSIVKFCTVHASL